MTWLVTGRGGAGCCKKPQWRQNAPQRRKGQFSFAGFRAKGLGGTGETAATAASQVECD
jgi:hypothetical protein